MSGKTLFSDSNNSTIECVEFSSSSSSSSRKFCCWCCLTFRQLIEMGLADIMVIILALLALLFDEEEDDDELAALFGNEEEAEEDKYCCCWFSCGRQEITAPVEFEYSTREAGSSPNLGAKFGC